MHVQQQIAEVANMSLSLLIIAGKDIPLGFFCLPVTRAKRWLPRIGCWQCWSMNSMRKIYGQHQHYLTQKLAGQRLCKAKHANAWFKLQYKYHCCGACTQTPFKNKAGQETSCKFKPGQSSMHLRKWCFSHSSYSSFGPTGPDRWIEGADIPWP